MKIPLDQLIEIRPVNSRVTEQEFVALHQIARVFKAYPDGDIWTAILTDGSVVALLDAPEASDG